MKRRTAYLHFDPTGGNCQRCVPPTPTRPSDWAEVSFHHTSCVSAQFQTKLLHMGQETLGGSSHCCHGSASLILVPCCSIMSCTKGLPSILCFSVVACAKPRKPCLPHFVSVQKQSLMVVKYVKTSSMLSFICILIFLDIFRFFQ